MSNSLAVAPVPTNSRALSSPRKVTASRPHKQVRTGVFGTASFRLAMMYAFIFGVSSVALSISLWRSTSGLLDQQTRDAVRVYEKTLSRGYRKAGLVGLVKSIKGSIEGEAGQHNLFLLVDSQGDRIAGNISRWPSSIAQPRQWYRLSIKLSDHHVSAFCQFFEIPGGYRLLVGHDTLSSLRLMRILQRGMLSALLEMGVLCLIGAVMVRTLAKRSIADLSSVVGAVAQGDLSRRVRQRSGGYEFDVIGATVNEMLDRINGLMDSVKNASNSIAHDLRTPITRVRIRLEDALLRTNDVQGLRQAIEDAMHDLDNVTSIFHAMLRIAEVESGSRRSAFRVCNLAAILSDLCELYEAVAEESSVVLVGHFDCAPIITGDEHLIQQAVANLVSNAIKFSPAQSSVKLLTRVENGLVFIEVQDHGPGIPEEDRERAVERFYRAEAARNTPGTGLGLAFVAAVCDLHGGSLSLEDNHPGLRALIKLPKSP